MKAKKYIFNGESLTIPEASKKYGIGVATIRNRMKNASMSNDDVVNKSTSHNKFLFNGELLTLREASTKYNLKIKTLWSRIRDGISPDDAVNMKLRKCQQHGMEGTKVYKTWCTMKERCYLPSNPSYSHYNARGIVVSDEFKDDFLTFYEHIGEPPSKEYSIDRIDNKGNYERGNIRWATAIEQARNRENTISGVVFGEVLTAIESAEKYKLVYESVIQRMKSKGISLEDSVIYFMNPKNRRNR